MRGDEFCLPQILNCRAFGSRWVTVPRYEN